VTSPTAIPLADPDRDRRRQKLRGSDVVANDVQLPADLHPGDLLWVACTGAYHHSMASTFNMVGRPPVVAVHDGRVRSWFGGRRRRPAPP